MVEVARVERLASLPVPLDSDDTLLERRRAADLEVGWRASAWTDDRVERTGTREDERVVFAAAAADADVGDGCDDLLAILRDDLGR